MSESDLKTHALSGENVLVTGATGFTGSHLVRKLVGLGARVTAIARSSSNITPFEGLDINWVRGDVFDEDTIEKAIQGQSYIFHVAAAFREAKITDETYYNVHVRSTQILAAKALNLPNFKRFIHTSTIGVHSHIEDPPADENYRFKPGDIYQETKAEAELWIRDFSEKNGLPYVVVRPSGIYGPEDKRLLKIYRMALKKWFPIIGYGKCLYHLIHVDDLADFFIHVANHPKALNDVFICGNTEHIALKDFVRIIADEFGVTVRIIRAPAWPLFKIAHLCEIICRPLGIEPPLYRRRVAFYTKDRSFNTNKMRNVLGFTPKYDNETGIRKTAQWYRSKGWV